MNEGSYVIGVDYGSDSVRTVVVNAANGEEIASSVFYYPRWKDGKYCNPAINQFRQHPLDYLEGLEATVKDCIAKAGADVAKNVKAISVDTTGSTPVAVDATGTPLALTPGFEENPNAMFVLWKDHTSTKEAAEINEHAKKFDTNYFIDNHDYILNGTGLQPSFTIPHTIDKDSTFRTNPEIFKEALEKFIFKYQEKFKAWQSGTIYDPSCCSSERMYTSTSNELPTLFEGILSKMYSSPYNWCGAGVNHFTIQTDGSYTNCEYIKTSSEEFLETIKEKCKNCEIKNYCQKPCIKNFEEGHEDSLEVQCTIRKILFNEVRKTLK